MMDLREEQRDGVTVLLVKWGVGVLHWDQGILTKTVRNLAARGQKRIVLDVSDIPYFDSDGIGELVQCMAIAARKGGEFKLINLHERIRDNLAITKLLPILSADDDEARGG